MKTVTIYTDGACSCNPGPGGWAAIWIYGEKKKEICGGEKENVRCGISEDVLATLKKGHGEIKTALKTPRFLYAGIRAGEKTGKVEFICGGKVIARADIVARESIAKTAVKKRRFLF